MALQLQNLDFLKYDAMKTNRLVLVGKTLKLIVEILIVAVGLLKF